MTVNALSKKLLELIEKGEGRTKVCVDKTTFDAPFEIVDIVDVTPEIITLVDGDGFQIVKARGGVREKRVITLKGAYDNSH